MEQKYNIFGFIFHSILIRLFLFTVAIVTLIITLQSRNVFAQSGEINDNLTSITILDSNNVVMVLDSRNDSIVNDDGLIYLPLAVNNFSTIPTIPNLMDIYNGDRDNYYSVKWQITGATDTYILQESLDASFSNPLEVYQGPNITWDVLNPGKYPATYYYRVRSKNSYGFSEWSQPKLITIYPLFVGLQIRWDGNGYIRTDEYYEVGTHDEHVFDILTEPDTIRSNNHFWYDPNPQVWEDDYWYSYYSVSTGSFKGSSYIGDPAWKWGYSINLLNSSQFTHGETVTINGKKFTVTGTHEGVTSWGTTIKYWEFTNQDKFLYWDAGGDWTQYVHKGDVVLRYDAGNSRLLLYDMVLRHDYYQGDVTPYTVQYTSKLTSANSIPNSPPLPAYIGVEEEPSKNMLDSISPNNEFQKGFIQSEDQEFRGNEEILR